MVLVYLASLKPVVDPGSIAPTMPEELVAQDSVEVGLVELASLEQLAGPCLVAPLMLGEPLATDTVGFVLLTLGSEGAAAMCSLEAVLMEQPLHLLAGSSQCHRNLMHRNIGH